MIEYHVMILCSISIAIWKWFHRLSDAFLCDIKVCVKHSLRQKIHTGNITNQFEGDVLHYSLITQRNEVRNIINLADIVI